MLIEQRSDNERSPLALTVDDAADQMVDLMLSILADGLDHPELWQAIPELVVNNPLLVRRLQTRLPLTRPGDAISLRVLLAMCGAALGELDEIVEIFTLFAADYSQSALIQGALFHLQGLQDPSNPKYALSDTFCETPFEQIDVLDGTSHLCCASWLQTSAGDLSRGRWEETWNSDAAQAIRASIHDGSYRYCNKGACPKLQGGALVKKAALAATTPQWRDVISRQVTALPAGPQTVNLAYDRTCNLSCPSCRVERYAADDATRARFATMQEQVILPMLKDARTVFVTGSGDPFASKNFRHLMGALDAHSYPDLKFQIMTNGMLLTPRQWASFPSLHKRVGLLKISIDAATGPTHESLRRGARWPTVMEKMAFAGELLAAEQIDNFELVFTVQDENYREMGDAVDLAHRVGANGIYFARLTNWGTFSAESYRSKAVFLPSHPDHQHFLECMQDVRLSDPIVLLGDLQDFVVRAPEVYRTFVH